MQQIQQTIIGTLESVKERLEKRDEDILNRPKVFAVVEPSEIEQRDDDAALENPNSSSSEVNDAKPAEFDQFKKVSFELLDIGLHYGNQGVDKITS